MAKAKMVNVEALVNLKYDKEVCSIGDTFKIKKKHLKEMTEKGYVTLIDEDEDENGSREDENDNEGE